MLVRTAPLFRRWLAAGVVLFAAAGASAQITAGPASLPSDLVRQPQLSPEGQRQVAAYLETWLSGLTSEDPERYEAARRAIAAPLRDSPSPSFRIEYGSKLKPTLESLAGSGRESDMVFAAMLAGDLATVDGHTVVLRLLGDTRPAVRYAAARAARVQLGTLEPGPAALNSQHRDAMIGAIARRVALESDSAVLDGLLTTATEAVRVEASWAGPLLTKLCAALPRQMKSVGTDGGLGQTRAVLRLVGAAQLHFRQRLTGVDAELAREAALLGGHAMGYVLVGVETGTPTDAEADALGQLVKAAHNLVFFASSALTGGQQADNELPDAFDRWRQSGRPAGLAAQIKKWIGPDGLLVRAPYSAAPTDFPPYAAR